MERKKIQVTLPIRLIEIIKQEARKSGVSPSVLLQEIIEIWMEDKEIKFDILPTLRDGDS